MYAAIAVHYFLPHPVHPHSGFSALFYQRLLKGDKQCDSPGRLAAAGAGGHGYLRHSGGYSEARGDAQGSASRGGQD